MQQADALRAGPAGEEDLKAHTGQTQEKVGSGQKHRTVEDWISFFHIHTPRFIYMGTAE